MSVGLLDHFNIRTRKLADTVRFYEDILGLQKGRGRISRFPAHGCTARAKRSFISSTFRRRRSNRSLIPVLSITSPSRAGVLPA